MNETKTLEKKISVIVPHVRGDYPYVEDPRVHNFHWLVDSLTRQDFPASDFELVLPDTLFESRKDYFRDHPQPFAVKHVPKKQTPWTRLGFCDISSGYNTGLIHADGELTLHLSSGCEFGPDLLRRCWEWHEAGRAVGILYDRKAGDSIVWQDGRREHVFGSGGKYFFDAPVKPFTSKTLFYQSFYGHQSVPLSACFKVNGYDELCDGTKGWNDVQFGVRLSKSGMNFVHDESIELVEHAHMDPGLPNCIKPDCHASRWQVFNEVRNEIMSFRTLDPDVSPEANRHPMPRWVYDVICKLTEKRGGEIPPWSETYLDEGLAFDLKNLWLERRRRDGLNA